MSLSTISYAQNREDIFINWLLDGKTSGFYIDVGASNPIHHSVTKYFYDKGWRGVNIDPIRRNVDLLNFHRKRDINVNCGIGSSRGSLVFREYPGADGLSTFSNEMKSEQQHVYKEYEVPVFTLAELLEEQLQKKEKIDFIKIDVEGFEYEVIKSNNWDKYRPTLVIVEANHIFKDWRPLLKKAGYIKVFFDGLNEYYIQESKFSASVYKKYPEFIIGPMPIYYEHLKEFERLKASNKSLDDHIHRLNYEVATLNLYIQNSKRIRSIVKQLLVSVHKASLTRIGNLKIRKARDFPPFVLDSGLKPADMVREIKKYDSDVYFDTKTGAPFIYKVAFNTYRLIHSIVKSCGIFSIKAIRKVRHG